MRETNLQLSLFDLEESEIFSDIQPHILSRFWTYHSQNQNVFDLYLRFAREVKLAGFKKYSTRAITERIRWHIDIETKAEPFKINDHYYPCYARLLIKMYPAEFEGFFELRSPDKRKAIYNKLILEELNAELCNQLHEAILMGPMNELNSRIKEIFNTEIEVKGGN